jgi:hypothetical protein
LSNVGRARLVLGCAVGVLCLVIVLWIVVRTTKSGEGSMGIDVEGESELFAIEGSAAQSIAPGVTVPIDLEFTNPNDVSISVTDLVVTVDEVSAPRADRVHACVREDFTVDQVSPDFEITLAAGATSTLSGLGVAPEDWPRVGMLDRSVNQDGCKGASLTLGFVASGLEER